MATDILERLTENCVELAKGSYERVTYTVPVQYHDKAKCQARGYETCDSGCPVRHEQRVRQVKRPGLLDQLKEFQANKDTDRNPKSERGAPRVKVAGKPPGDMQGFFTLDEITCEAYSVVDRILEEGGRDRVLATYAINEVLQAVPYQMEQINEARPDLVREMFKYTEKWIAKAKAALRISVSDAMFADTVCGNCGGGLSVAWDNSSEVKCIGTPSEPPCGETYPMSEWVSLYEKGKR